MTLKMKCSSFVFLLFTLTCKSNAASLSNKYQKYLELDAVEKFREYIRIDTSKVENLKYAVDFWIHQATELGIPYAVYEPAGQPIFVATVQGADPALPSIMLNSHMDVVSANENEWLYPPFEAHMDSNGDIYGRGTQDTKDVAIQYIEAIKRLRENNVTLARTIHLTVVPAEETGGKEGMKAFVKTKEFKSLNIGFALDEGSATTEDQLFTVYVDRRPWQIKFIVHGEGGHSYKMPDNTAMENVQKLIDAIMAYRETQKDIMKTKDSADDFSGFNSVNINMLNGGQAVNVIPSELTLDVDMRLSPEADAEEVQELVNSWAKLAGNNTEVLYLRRETDSASTAVDDSNPYWVTLRDTLKTMGIKVTPQVCPASTDMLALRNMGIPAFGFSTKSKTIPRLHARNEYQNVETFVKGIHIYTEVIKNLANLKTGICKKNVNSDSK